MESTGQLVAWPRRPSRSPWQSEIVDESNQHMNVCFSATVKVVVREGSDTGRSKALYQQALGGL